jgi:Ca2+/Na+ antiporter
MLSNVEEGISFFLYLFLLFYYFISKYPSTKQIKEETKEFLKKNNTFPQNIY